LITVIAEHLLVCVLFSLMEVCYMKLCHRLCLQLFGCCLMQKSMLMLAPRYLSADTVANMMYFVDLVSEKMWSL